MKTCKACKETKPETEFYKEGSGLRAICKACRNKKVQEWREANRDHYNESHRKYAAKHYRRLHLQRYKLTPEQYQQMLEQQQNKCAICSKPPGGSRPLAVDHCHATGAVRGLLCYNCNRGLHLIESEHFATAVAYLQAHRPK